MLARTEEPIPSLLWWKRRMVRAVRCFALPFVIQLTLLSCLTGSVNTFLSSGLCCGQPMQLISDMYVTLSHGGESACEILLYQLSYLKL